MSSLRSAVCCPVTLCYPVLELLNNSPGDKDLSTCQMRALSISWGLSERPCSSLVPLLHKAFLPSTAILPREILQSNLQPQPLPSSKMRSYYLLKNRLNSKYIFLSEIQKYKYSLWVSTMPKTGNILYIHLPLPNEMQKGAKCSQLWELGIKLLLCAADCFGRCS